jgi:hypothetical protein
MASNFDIGNFELNEEISVWFYAYAYAKSNWCIEGWYYM